MKTGASPLFNYRNPSLDVNGNDGIDFRNHLTYGPYTPFDTFFIVNNSDEKVKLTFNGGQTRHIFPGQVMGYDEQEIVSFRIENAGTDTIPAAKIEIEFQRSPYDADAAARDSLNPLSKLGKLIGGLF